jgi:proteasome lid subunit RPN8/RPN11
MKAKSKLANGQPFVSVDSEVVRKIRQHARSENATEICGVLIGRDKDQRIDVTASIEGQNADQAGAHVTFTQDTWEHIYAVKDKLYPNDRIVGWYHSHPGFGIFLSEHDTFIHKNFFSSPGQVAWVFDPHSDEEGCFGWVDGRIERLSRIAVQDRRGGEMSEAGTSHATEIDVAAAGEENHAAPQTNGSRVRIASYETDRTIEEGSISLEQLVAKVFFSLTLILLSGVLCWYFFPRTELLPVLVDPVSGSLIDARTGEVVGHVQLRNSSEQGNPGDPASPPSPDVNGKKSDDAQSK